MKYQDFYHHYRTFYRFVTRIPLLLLIPFMATAQEPITAVADSPDLKIKHSEVNYNAELDLMVFEITVEGTAGHTLPQAKGKMDGAPVLGYVFPTTLKSTDVGFSPVDGIVALAITAHPDFDDTPLWDENGDRDYTNDGITWHSHWVVLIKEKRASGGLAVKEFAKDDSTVILPPTSPNMPMYMDSPGFNVVQHDNTLRVPVPAFRMNHQHEFQFDAVTAYMQVAQSGDLPLLGVYKIYSVLSGDLSLPYKAK